MESNNNENKKSFFDNKTVQPEAKKAKNFLKDFFKGILDITEGVSKPKAVEEIKDSISFRGHQAWILVFSIMVASIGLSADSPAVVIGAMLISPLMGPIVGVGYSIGVNDFETLRRSLMNLLVMVVISLITSYIYFWLNPFSELNPTKELLARTYPTILDVFIATFGGLAGAVALTRKEKSNVVPGVAIATALMPPLCTAGYGLAIGNYAYFGGAIYLFFINSVFIALTTLLIVKLLRFPLAKYQDAVKRRRTNIFITLIAIVTIVPSAFFFINALREGAFKTQTVKFINDEMIDNFPKSNFIYDTNKDFQYNKDSVSYVTVWNSGERVSEDVITMWNNKIKKDPYQQNVQFLIRQDEDVRQQLSQMKEGVIQELIFDQKHTIAQKDSLIQTLRKELSNHKNVEQNEFPIVTEKAKTLFPDLDYFGYAMFDETNFKQKASNIPTAIISWKDSISSEVKKDHHHKLMKWLKVELKVDTIQIIEN
ncbi:hypothetical protein UJ101_02351 [Flavobacteriaceae bacterium UJ101]|nr:hypothetical protein UJ101_02351 [Flavobacteriaceae bacterium UJ101]